MPKFGKGLNNEFVDSVIAGEIKEPFTTDDVRKFADNKGWNPSDNYIKVLLSNGSSESHSHTYKKLFVSLGNGLYKLSDLAK